MAGFVASCERLPIVGRALSGRLQGFRASRYNAHTCLRENINELRVRGFFVLMRNGILRDRKLFHHFQACALRIARYSGQNCESLRITEHFGNFGKQYSIPGGRWPAYPSQATKIKKVPKPTGKYGGQFLIHSGAWRLRFGDSILESEESPARRHLKTFSGLPALAGLTLAGYRLTNLARAVRAWPWLRGRSNGC